MALKLPPLSKVILKHDFANVDHVTLREIQQLIRENRALTPRHSTTDDQRWGEGHTGLINSGDWMDDGDYVFFHMEPRTYMEANAAMTLHFRADVVAQHGDLMVRGHDLVLHEGDLWIQYEQWCDRHMRKPVNRGGFRDDVYAAMTWPGKMGHTVIRYIQAIADAKTPKQQAALDHEAYRYVLHNAPIFTPGYTFQHEWTRRYFNEKWTPSPSSGAIEPVLKGALPLRAASRIIIWASADEGTDIDPTTGEPKGAVLWRRGKLI